MKLASPAAKGGATGVLPDVGKLLRGFRLEPREVRRKLNIHVLLHLVYILVSTSRTTSIGVKMGEPVQEEFREPDEMAK